MANPKLLYLFSPNAPMGSQLFSLGNGADGAYNPGAGGGLDDFDVYQFTTFNIANGITISRTPNRGPVVILVQGDATIAGSFNLNSVGNPGGWGRDGKTGDGFRGDGIGGGNGGNGTNKGGGGGGFGAPGGTNGGIAWSDADLSTFEVGSSGGGGYNGNAAYDAGDGGISGGALLLIARKITLSGSIVANGGAGSVGGNDGQMGSGGGGSGGAIWLVALEIGIGTNLITATGGAGGSGGLAVPGGAGAVGRIRLDYASLTGSTNPAAHEHSGVTIGYLKQFAASAGLGA